MRRARFGILSLTTMAVQRPNAKTAKKTLEHRLVSLLTSPLPPLPIELKQNNRVIEIHQTGQAS